MPNSGQKLGRLNYQKPWEPDFLSYLKTLEKTKHVIACGDFNVAHHPIALKNDKANYSKTAGYTQIKIDGMENFINSGFWTPSGICTPMKWPMPIGATVLRNVSEVQAGVSFIFW